jgi:hypothetical protein
LVDVFLGYSHNSFENPGNVLTNRKEEIKIQKRIVNALPVFKRVLKIKKLLVLSS